MFKSVVLVSALVASGGHAAAAVCDDGNAATNDSCAFETGCVQLGTVAGADTPLRGNDAGGTLHVDACPAGQVMVGVKGAIGASWDQIQVVCGVPTIDDALAVSLAAGATLPLRGTNAGTAVIATCPADEVVVGFEGRAGALVDQIILQCAPAMSTAGTPTWNVTLGNTTAHVAVGGTGGVAFAPTNCTAGHVAIGANIRAGGSIDAFGLICGAYVATDGMDRDCDTVPNSNDNCPAIANLDQADLDMDGTGNACDATHDGDVDGDGVSDPRDNCPVDVNPDQDDDDDDGIGDECDPDAKEVSTCNASASSSGAALTYVMLAATLIWGTRRRRRAAIEHD